MNETILLLRSKLRIWLGSGLFLSWVFTLLSFEGVIRTESPDAFTGVVHDPFFLAATLCAGILLIAASFIPFSFFTNRMIPHVRIVSIIATICAAVMVILCGIIFTETTEAAVPAGIIIGCVIAHFSLVWITVLSSEELRDVLKLVAMTILVVAVLSVLCRLIGEIHVFLSAAFNIVFLIASCALLVSKPCAPPLPPSPKAKRPLVARSCILFFVLGFTCQYSWTFFLKASPHYQSTGFTVVYMVGTLIAAACMIVLVFRRAKLGMTLSLVYSLMIFLIIGSLCLELFSNEVLFIAYTTNQVAYYFMQTTLWFIVFVLTFKLSDSPFRITGLNFGLMYLGTFAGFLLCSQIGDYLLENHVASNATIAITLAVVAFTALFIFRASDLTHLAKQGTDTTDPHFDEKLFDERLVDLAKKCGLSPRETDVFCLLAKGRNAVFIQEKLVVSYSTVSTHRQSIYRKLNVHTQQDLLDFVERSIPTESHTQS